MTDPFEVCLAVKACQQPALPLAPFCAHHWAMVPDVVRDLFSPTSQAFEHVPGTQPPKAYYTALKAARQAVVDYLTLHP